MDGLLLMGATLFGLVVPIAVVRAVLARRRGPDPLDGPFRMLAKRGWRVRTGARLTLARSEALSRLSEEPDDILSTSTLRGMAYQEARIEAIRRLRHDVSAPANR